MSVREGHFEGFLSEDNIFSMALGERGGNCLFISLASAGSTFLHYLGDVSQDLQRSAFTANICRSEVRSIMDDLKAGAL